MTKKALIVVGIAMLMDASAASATETITYVYDARGRLIQVVHTGSVNNNVTTNYTQDKVENRSNVATTGAP